ncbi:MAG: type II secretion system protein [Kiritimatiellia bacterium]
MKQNKGFTLVEIMIVVAIIALLAAIAIPSFMKSRQDSRRSACVNNLRLIDHAKQQVATASQTMTDSSTPDWSDIKPYIKGNAIPLCRDAGTYVINVMTSNPTCSQSGGTFLHVMKSDVN